MVRFDTLAAALQPQLRLQAWENTSGIGLGSLEVDELKRLRKTTKLLHLDWVYSFF